MAGSLAYLKNVTTLSLDGSRCTGCGRCEEVCPHGVWAVHNGKAAILDHDACMECGACARNCPFEAVFVSAGVGCATAVIRGAIKGTAPDCCCSGDIDCC